MPAAFVTDKKVLNELTNGCESQMALAIANSY